MNKLAHEVYVLPTDVVEKAITTDSPNPFSVINTQGGEFAVWGVALFVIFALSLIISFWHKPRKALSPVWEFTKRYAPHFVRSTLGLTIFVSGVMGALFGPELPLVDVFGPFALGIKVLMLMVGPLIVIGFYPRVTAAVVIALYGFGLMYSGTYIAAYAGFLGAALFILLRESSHYKKSAFFILRVFYGGAIISAALFAKFFHSNLALETVNMYSITDYMPFTPMFLVLGAFLVEMIVGICIMFGIQLRLVLIIFTGFLTQSLMFFNEAVWPHLILFGLNFALFAHGYDKHTLLSKFTKDSSEPVL